MQKIAKKIAIGAGVVVVGGYALLFTGPGNSLIGSYVETMINSDPNVPITVEKFSMQTDSVDMQLKVADVIDARVYGDYSFFGGDFDGKFELSISDMKRINIAQLKDAGATGSFHTNGVIQSTDTGYALIGNSKMYGGDIAYKILLDDTTVSSLNFKLKNADLKNLLLQAKQLPVMDGKLNIVANLDSVEEGNLKGVVTTTLSDGKMDEEAYKFYYGKEAPKNFNFSTKVVSNIDGDKVLSNINFDSTYASLISKEIGVDLKTHKLWGNYEAQLKPSDPNRPELKMVPILTTGTVGGTIEKAIVDGISAMYASNTTYKLEFQKGELRTVDANIKGMSLAAITKATGQKATADAALDVSVDIDDAREGRLRGLIISDMRDFKPNMKMLQDEFGSELPKKFNLTMHSETKLEGNHALINSNVTTDVGTLDVKDMMYYLKSGYSEGDYTIKTANFAALAKAGGMSNSLPKEFASSKDSVTINGKIRTGRALHITGVTELLGGKLAFVLNDNDLKVDIINTGVNLSKGGKKTYRAKANGTIKHNIKTQQGEVLFTLAQGDTLLEVKKAIYDVKQQKIDASILMSGFGKKLSCDIKGSIDNPKIVMKSDEPLISNKYRDMMLQEIDTNIKDKKQKKDIKMLISFLSKKNGTLTQKEMAQIDKSIKNMVKILKSKYKKVENVRFTKEHLDNLKALSEKMRKEKGMLSDAEIKEIENRSKAIVKAIQKEWSSSANKKDRKATLAYFERLGAAMSKHNVSKEDMDKFKKELYVSIDTYQDILGDKKKIELELKKYEPLEKIAKMFGKKDAFNKEKIYALIKEFNVMMNIVQIRIAQSDMTSEQQEIVRSIGDTFKKNSVMISESKDI